MNIEEKVWLLVKKYWLPKTDRVTKTLPYRGIEWFIWNQGGKVAYFACFGEPWYQSKDMLYGMGHVSPGDTYLISVYISDNHDIVSMKVYELDTEAPAVSHL